MIMTYKMSYKLAECGGDLLAAPITWFEALQADPTLPPDAPGLYAWWFRGPIGDAPIEAAAKRDGLAFLYVGIASGQSAGSMEAIQSNPKLRTPSRRTLRRRLREHVRGPLARSTLRRSLAALLAPTLGLEFVEVRSGRKPVLANDGEARLSAWMAENAAVSWMEHPEPWLLESELIEHGPVLPLNVRGARHDFAPALRRRRRLSVGPTPHREVAAETLTR